MMVYYMLRCTFGWRLRTRPCPPRSCRGLGANGWEHALGQLPYRENNIHNIHNDNNNNDDNNHNNNDNNIVCIYIYIYTYNQPASLLGQALLWHPLVQPKPCRSVFSYMYMCVCICIYIYIYILDDYSFQGLNAAAPQSKTQQDYK